MRRGDRRVRFTQTLQRVMRESSKESSNYRPATGFVGQRCLGYVQDKNGQLLMIKPDFKSEDMIGPGTYDPYKYERMGGRSVLSRNSKRTPWAKNEFKAGPADYVTTYKSTKIQHKFGPDDRSKLPKSKKIQPPLSGELGHESWIKKPPKIPKNRFPQTKFIDQKSRPFASKVTRELFSNQNTETPGPGDYEIKIIEEVEPEEESSSIFKNRLERFQEITSFTPSPCAYTLPSSLGDAPAFSLCPLMDEVKPQPDDTPGPGQYEVEPIKVVHRDKSRPERKFHSVLGDNIKRRKPPKETSPPVGAYNIAEQELTDTIPRIIQSIRYNQADAWIQNVGTPGPGAYDPKYQDKKKRVPRLNTSAHPRKPNVDRYEDSNLAFTTLHGDFIIKSSNKHYNKDLENWR